MAGGGCSENEVRLLPKGFADCALAGGLGDSCCALVPLVVEKEKGEEMKNWKTTIFGLIASLPVMLPMLGVPHFGHLGNVTIDQAVGGLGALLLGYFAKDRNVTGGTIQQ